MCDLLSAQGFCLRPFAELSAGAGIPEHSCGSYKEEENSESDYQAETGFHLERNIRGISGTRPEYPLLYVYTFERRAA